MRYRRIVCAMFVLSIAGFAVGKAIKVMELTPVNGENPNADGMLMINANDNGVQVQIILKDFAPNQFDPPYSVRVEGVAAGGIPTGMVTVPVTTNPSGNGTEHVSTGDFTIGAECVDVVVFIDDNGDKEPQAAEERAFGTGCR